MEAYMTQISNYLLRQSWQIAILVVIVAVVSWLLRNKSAHIRYLLWLIILAKCLVPPVTTVPLAILPEESVSESTLIFPIEEQIITNGFVDIFGPEYPPGRLMPEQRTSRPVANERANGFTIRQRLGAVWIAGVVLFALIAMVKALRTELWLRRQRKLLPDELQDQIENIFSDLNFKTFPKVWLVEGIGQPFVWGLLRGGVYLPSDFVNVNSAEQRRGILGHELSHVLRFDAAVNILQLIAQAVFWFHPFVWWANKKIRAEREKCCDEVTIAGLGAKARDYSKAIVNILISEQQVRPVPSIAVAGPVKNIEERIKTMLRPGKKFYKRPSFVVASIIILLALLTVPIGCVLTNRAETETASDFNKRPTNSLHYAAADGDIEQVKLLIAKGADVNEKDKRGNAPQAPGQTPLLHAASGGHVEIARVLIASGADVNMSMEGQSWTPLLDAVNAGHTKLVKLLLENGARANVGDNGGYTPLYYAIWNDDEESVRMLITNGADLKTCPNRDYLPLFYAVWQGHTGIVKAIIDGGADVNAEYENKDGWTPLHYALYETDADVARQYGCRHER
jgi:beta-lactamase regulating signal transducer with metallopeptidase domain